MAGLPPPEAMEQATDGKLYQALAIHRNFKPSIVELSDGTQAFWIGEPHTEKIVLYFHGGGFRLAMNTGHLGYSATLADTFKAASKSVGILALSYNLSGTDTYPRQLQQAVELVRYALQSLRKKPSDIILLGDSAGANLTLAIMSHILHPHSEIPPLSLESGSKFRAAVLISPWVSNITTWPSYEQNKNTDMMTVDLLGMLIQAYLGKAPLDNYAEPAAAEESWFKGLPVSNVLITAGGAEILQDSIEDFGKKLSSVAPGVEVVVVDGEWHDPVHGGYGGKYALEATPFWEPTEQSAGEIARSWMLKRL